MAFQQGLSGLNSASIHLDVISRNIANSNTVGYKSGSTHSFPISSPARYPALQGGWRLVSAREYWPSPRSSIRAS
jgi:hypothetical protein